MQPIIPVDIFEYVRALDLPLGGYAVTAGGVLAAHGIRANTDIDLLVAPELYEELKTRGWKEVQKRPDFSVVVAGICEASPVMMTVPGYDIDPAEIIRRADVMRGIAFARLEDVAAFKRALGRPKDCADIELIEARLRGYPQHGSAGQRDI